MSFLLSKVEVYMKMRDDCIRAMSRVNKVL